MKHYKKLLILMIFSLIAGIAGGVYILKNKQVSNVDIVLLNDIAKTAEECAGDIEKISEYSFEEDFIIFNKEGSVVYSSADTDIKNVADAIKQRYPYVMLTKDGSVTVGAAILKNNDDLCENRIQSAFTFIFVAAFIMFSCIISWYFITKYKIVRPFQKMETFAGKVAEGNLDVPLEMEKDNMFGIFTEAFDLMRTELAKSRDREIQLKRREKELIASLSHDLKTPITGIKLTAELMQAQTTTPATLEKLGNIYKKADQIDRLVNDLFTSTMKDLGEMNVNVDEVSSQVLREFVNRCDDKNLVKQAIIPDCLIKIDCRRMEQIIGNIITNSYKYADTEITVDYEIIDGFLKMSIRDFGNGVPSDELQLVTNKFYRSKNLKDEKTEGSGLGLYIAKTLIEKMDGELRCKNAEPGFRVRLLIPLA